MPPTALRDLGASYDEGGDAMQKLSERKLGASAARF